MRRLILSLLATASFSAVASSYYVVVPVPNKKVTNTAINVELASFSLPAGLIGTPYAGFNFKSLLSVTGDPDYTGYGVKWNLVSGSLPAGLAFNADGSVSGTPTAAGTASFQVQASYKTKTGATAYQIIVADITVALAAGTPPQGIVGQAYSYDLKPLLTVSGDPAYVANTGVTWTYSASSLPAGLYLTAGGVIAGTPTAGGTGTITARATYKNRNGVQTYSVTTLAITVGLGAGSPPEGLVGQAYSYDLKPLLTVSGDSAYTPGDVVWSTVSSTLPAGLSLSSAGVITGTPTAGGTGSVTARATYKNIKGEQTYDVVSLDIKVALAAGTPPRALLGQTYNYDLKSLLTVTGDNGYSGVNVTWNLASGGLPAGLVLSPAGIVTGTPTIRESKAVQVTATYKNVSASQGYTLEVADALKNFGAYRAWAGGGYAATCNEYRNPPTGYSYQGAVGDGVYRLSAGGYTFDAYCDMSQDGGGWTRVGVFNGTTDTTLAVEYRNNVAYTQAKISLNGVSTKKAIVCHATPRTGFAMDTSAGVNCTIPDSDGVAYSIRVLQQSTTGGAGGNYGLYRSTSLNASGGCNWLSDTLVWGRHWTGVSGSNNCTAFGAGEALSSPNTWGANQYWLLVR